MRKTGPSDPELLAEWLHHKREPAFHELVSRYAGLVHATALRTCSDDSLAAEASQLTFILLARKAKSLASCRSLGGWLHRSALLQSKNLLRGKRREQRKLEQLAMEPHSPSQGDSWREIQPVLDESLAVLSDKDREALLLRFYRALSVREVAETLGIATDAAQKRIDRATERLRAKLLHRGCQTGGSLPATMLAGFTADTQAAVPAVSLLASKAIAAGAAGTGVFSTATAFLSATAMKTTSVAVPLVSLLAVGAWIASQLHSMADLERQNARLRKQLVSNPSMASAAATRIPIKTALDQKPIDWEEVARQLGSGDSWGYLQTNLPLLEALQSMTESELVGALDEISAVSISPQAREVLDRKLGALLMTKNPELGLTRFVHRCRDSDWSWLLAGQFERWAKEDPDKAIAWFAGQLAAGSFNSRKLAGGLDVPREIVSEPVFTLLSSAPDAAGRLLSTLPEDLRLKSLVSIRMAYLKENDHPAWAQMVRDHIPEAGRIEAITWPTKHWGDGDGAPMDLSETSAYLARIGATEQEIEACVLCVAGQVHSWRPFFTNEPKTPEDGIESLRAWVAKETPLLVDRATANALGALAVNIGHGDHFPEAARLAFRYHKPHGGDDLLIQVLESSSAYDHRELARSLVARLSDAQRREKYLKDFNDLPSK